MPVRTSQGFTLIELVISLAIGSIVLAGLVSFFITQQKHYNVREQVAAMQENTRMGLDFMARELAMAGYDPAETSGAGIVLANATTLQVTIDLNGNGTTADAGENVTYGLYDYDKDGDQDLGRTVGGVTELIAEHIAALGFMYTLADGTVTATPADPSQIRVVAITLTGRTSGLDPQYPAHGGYRNLTLTTTVLVRNMAL
jgi:type IV pilus assembly protein PilW